MKNITIILSILIIPILAFVALDKAKGVSDIALASDRPSFMLFTSTMCLDCQNVKKELAQIEDKYSDKINIVKINALEKDDKTKKMVDKYNVNLVPTLIFIDKNDKIRYRLEGYMSKEEMTEQLESMLNG